MSSASDDTSMMEQPLQQRRRRRRTTVEENTHQFDIVSLLFERGMQDLANERLHALLEGGEDDVDEEDTMVEDTMCVEETHDDDGHTIEEAAAADHHINIEPQTSSEHNIQELQTQEEEQLQARIQAMEYELSIRRARTERLRAVINVVQTFHNTASPFSYRHPYHHQKEISRRGGSLPPPMIPTLELDEPPIILISPCISRSNSVCSSLDGYDDDEEEPSPPCKKQRRR